MDQIEIENGIQLSRNTIPIAIWLILCHGVVYVSYDVVKADKVIHHPYGQYPPKYSTRSPNHQPSVVVMENIALYGEASSNS